MSPRVARLRSLARHVPGVPRARRELWEQRSINAIAGSGLFDDHWYRLQTGRDDLVGRAGVEHYVRHGRREGLSPAPFFEPRTFDQSWRRRVEDPFALFLRDGQRRRSTRWHPVVSFPEGDLRRDEQGSPEPPRPDARVVLQLDEVTAGTATWGEVVTVLHERVRRWRAQEDTRGGSVRSAQRPRQEASFRAAMARRALPATPDGEVLVSVVMPTWNRQALVGRSLRSVQEQSLQGWEVLVADDGSSDDTVAVLEGVSHFDPRVRVLRLPHRGVSSARNEAVRAARGRYVAFLDSDNTWEPDFLELMIKGMEATGSDAAFSSVELVSSNGRDYRIGTGRREDLLVGNHVDLNALVVRSEALERTGGFDEELRRTVDYDLVLRLSEAGDLRFLPFVGVVYDDDEAAGTSDRISVREPLTWDFVTRARHMVDWDHLAARPSDPGRISVLMTTASPGWATLQSLRSVLEQTDVPGTVEVVLVDRGGSRTDAGALGLLELGDERVHVVRTAVDVGVPLALDVALARATGATAVLLPPGLVLEPGALRAVVAPLEAGASCAQVVALDGRDLLVGAGATLPRRGLPLPVLQGHAVTELDGAPPLLPVAALFGGGLAARTAEVVAAHGLNPLLAGHLSFTDLSLRLSDIVGTSPVAVAGARARTVGKSWSGPLATTDRGVFRTRHEHRPVDTGALRELGLDVAALSTRSPTTGSADVVPLLHRPRRTVEAGPAAGLPRLRWALVTAAPAGPRGNSWGDKHFADALARALRRLGQDAHVYAREAHERPSAYLDDVRLVLRGLDPVVVDPGRVTITWVISHPDEVDDAELRSGDAVFAAGRPWAREASRRSGRLVGFLPQCTDPALFRPGALPPTGSPDRLFVGNSRNVARPSVAALVAAGVPVDVYGGGWEGLVPASMLQAPYLPNDRLGQAYWDAGVVLNDHWADMRDHGFISNRVFDAAAAGGRVLSDHVDGLDDLLPGVVQTWRSPAQLLDLATRAPHELFGSDDDRRERARAVAREHSFDARALELLRTATGLDGR